MFREALLESAPVLRRRNHWPMATAFTVELIAATALVLLPLLSTGIIPLSGTIIVPTPPKYTPLANREPVSQPGGHAGTSFPVTAVVTVPTGGRIFRDTPTTDPVPETGDPNPNFRIGGDGDPNSIRNLVPEGQPVVTPPPAKPVVISHTTEAMLMTKVIPEYPRIAKIAGIQGDVKLHAFVSRDGIIRSLTVLGTPPPVLAKAALDAVQQWKYHPYLLNGEPVEIETFITVTFRQGN